MKSVRIISAIVMLAATAGIASALSLSAPQEVEAQCEEKGKPNQGARVIKCEFHSPFIDCKSTSVLTPSGNQHFSQNCK